MVAIHKLIAIQEVTHDPDGKTCIYALDSPDLRVYFDDPAIGRNHDETRHSTYCIDPLACGFDCGLSRVTRTEPTNFEDRESVIEAKAKLEKAFSTIREKVHEFVVEEISTVVASYRKTHDIPREGSVISSDKSVTSRRKIIQSR
jgi:hypothetical protein